MLGFPAETTRLEITAASPIIGFELFGTSQGNQLAGSTRVGISTYGGVLAKVRDDSFYLPPKNALWGIKMEHLRVMFAL